MLLNIPHTWDSFTQQRFVCNNRRFLQRRGTRSWFLQLRQTEQSALKLDVRSLTRFDRVHKRHTFNVTPRLYPVFHRYVMPPPALAITSTLEVRTWQVTNEIKDESDRMRPSRANSWTEDAAPIELAMPIEGRDPVVDRIERQFDQLLDLLASDQVHDGLDIQDPSSHWCRNRNRHCPMRRWPRRQTPLELSIVMPCFG